MSAICQRTRETWIRRAGIALLLLVAANLLSWRFVDPDLWGHIQYGEDWIAEGALPRVASHTFSAEGHPWINHENLSELTLAMSHRLVGGRGIMVMKLLAGLGMLLTMMWLAVRKGIPVWAAAVCIVFVASGLGEFWLARPQMASFLGMAALLTVFDFAFPTAENGERPRPQLLWLCVPLMILWTNSHGGFAAGLCVLLTTIAIRTVQVSRSGADNKSQLVRTMMIIGVCCVAATVINPYGTGLHSWMLASLGKPRPEISEWASVLNGGVAAIPFTVLTALTVMAFAATTRKRDPAHMIILSLVAIQAAMHIRHIAFLAILFGFWMPAHCWSAWQRFLACRQQRTGRDLADDPPLTRGAFAILSLEAAVVGLLLTGLLGWRFSNFGVDRSKYPVSAINYMAQNDLQGRLVVTFNWAQYAIAALNPQTTVSFDGRFRTCYPQEVIDMNFDLTNGVRGRFRSRGATPPDPARVLEWESPQLVLLDRHLDPAGIELMSQRSDWTLLYRDEIAALWGRTSEFTSTDSPRFLPPSKRMISDAEQAGIASWPAIPGREGRLAFVPNHRTTQTARRELNARH